jgi:hypothetical protein
MGCRKMALFSNIGVTKKFHVVLFVILRMLLSMVSRRIKFKGTYVIHVIKYSMRGID